MVGNKTNKSTWIGLAFLFLTACSSEEMSIPRPIANLRVVFPERQYQPLDINPICHYQFELASYMKATPVAGENPCHLDIDLGQFNGMLHLSYVPIENNLPALISYSLEKVREHQVKASAIQDSVMIIDQEKVYGTFFEFYGNAATPFQFHFTDSAKHFVRGTIYFNATPNFDSIYPVLQYIKPDLIHLVKTNRWK